MIVKASNAHLSRPYTRADIFAEQTKTAQRVYAREAAAYAWVSQSRPNSLPSLRLESAEREYTQALRRELEAFRGQKVNLQVKSTISDAIARAGLLARGAARVSMGLSLGIIWGAVCGCLLPEIKSEQLGDLALSTLYQGGLTDIERATSSSHSALSAKRFYQLYAEIQQAMIANRPLNTEDAEGGD
jgi:hypothetical protein